MTEQVIRATHQTHQRRDRRATAGVADVVYWDTACPGFGVKVTPKGRKVFLVLYPQDSRIWT